MCAGVERQRAGVRAEVLHREGEIAALEQVLIEDESYKERRELRDGQAGRSHTCIPLDLSETNLNRLRNLFLYIPLCISHPISHSQNNLKVGYPTHIPG